MKKPRISGRTCPHCLVVVDPVFYGWHVGKCSSRTITSQDTAPLTPMKNEVAGHSYFVKAPVYVPSSDFETAKREASGRSGLNMHNVDSSNAGLHHLREENQALKEDVKQHLEEIAALKNKVKYLELELKKKGALMEKVNFLELKLEDLELQLKLSEEAKEKALSSLGSLHDSLKQKLDQGNGDDLYNHPRHSNDLESFGRVDCLGAAGLVDKEIHHKQVELVDNVQGNGAVIDPTKGNDKNKRLSLDRIVDLACGEGAMSDGFLSPVDQVLEAKEAIPPALNGSRKQRILFGALSYVSNDNTCQDIAEGSSHLHTSELGAPNQDIASKEALDMSSAPRDPVQTQFLRKDLDNTGCATGLQANQDGDVNKELLSKTSDSMRDTGANMADLEMQPHALDTSLHTGKETSRDLLYVNSDKEMPRRQVQSPSVSAGSDLKARPGFRRMVLQSDSESESGNMQGVLSSRDIHSVHLCDTKKNASHPMSSDADGEKSDQSSVLRLQRRSESNRASQPHIRRSKRLNTACISDQSDELICIGENDMRNRRSAEAPDTTSLDLGGIGVDGITDVEHTGLRRSKRLRTMRGSKYRSQKESMHLEKASCSDEETSASLGGSELSKSEASARTPIVSRKGLLRTRKRLFMEEESRPSYGTRDSTGRVEDSEIESDADSLGDFITDSEGTEVSRSSHEDRVSTSGSDFSREVYCDPKHKRDIRMKNYVWELEGEMLAVLATNPTLCLRAVCALNRRQTEDEQTDKISKYRNKRGFDKPHAERGSRIAEFLTDGNAAGPVKKSIEDLAKFDAGGVEFCKMLASKHSKQLFQMYMNEEDPHFPFS